MRKVISAAIAMLTAAGVQGAWTPRLEPADSNFMPAARQQDRSIRLLAGAVQPIDMLLTDGAEGRKQGACEVKVTVDLPPGVKLLSNRGIYRARLESQQTTPEGRNVYRYIYPIEFDKAHGDHWTEWNNNTFFVETPASVAPEQSYLEITADEAGKTATRRYPLELFQFTPAAKIPKKITVGMWDYNFARAGAASSGVADLLKKSGIRWTSEGKNEYAEALKAAGIAVGGYVHHNAFYNHAWQDETVGGGRSWGGYPCPYCVSQLPEDTPLTGVDALVKAADRTGGWATYDYEPSGISGFCPKAIEAFCKEDKISEAEFKQFREFLKQNGRIKTDQSNDPVISKIWTAWGEFRTRTSDEYARRIYKQFKAQRPDAKLALTPSGSYKAGSPMARLHGCNQSGLTAGADVIMPQTYRGYGAADNKLALVWTGDWKKEADQINPEAELWSMILIRYAGAWAGNTPNRVRLQMIGMAAEGADGMVLYYPGNMDAPYWQMVAKGVEELAEYEDFYLNGKRCEEKFKLNRVPTGYAMVNAYPEMQFKVTDPAYAFYAHGKDGKILLTLMNLEELNDVVFSLDLANYKVVSTTPNIEPFEGDWLVKCQDAGYMILEPLKEKQP